MGAFLEGRVTYELMEKFLAHGRRRSREHRADGRVRRIWRDMPKFVYSRTLAQAGGNTTVVRNVVPEEVMALKAEAGGDLALGGAELGAAFLRHDLVDELRLYVHPVVLRAGTPMFPRSGSRLDFRLVESRPFGNGVVLLRHRRPDR